jgi:hypothetical protein
VVGIPYCAADINYECASNKVIAGEIIFVGFSHGLNHVSYRTVDQKWLGVAEGYQRHASNAIKKEASLEKEEQCPEQCAAAFRARIWFS